MSIEFHNSFITYCHTIEDHRQPIKRTYPLDEILFLGLCATLAGCEGWNDIHFFGENNIDFLKEYLPYKEGIASVSTIFRVLSTLSNDGFKSFFLSWFNGFNTSEYISIDGKVVKGSKRDGKSALHILHACDSASGVIIGYKEVGSKTNEIPVAPDLIKELDIEGKTVTLDAMGCQKSTCEAILSQGGDYTINLKGNQGNLHDDVKLLFDEKEHLLIDTATEIEKGHGRIEERTIYATEDISYLVEKYNWPGIKSIIMCKNRRLDKKSKEETLYYISSHKADAINLQKCIRSHWSVESMHWILDVTFNEDAIPISADNGAENLAFLRRVALNLLKIYQKTLTKNVSIRRLKMTCLAKPESIKDVLKANNN